MNNFVVKYDNKILELYDADTSLLLQRYISDISVKELQKINDVYFCGYTEDGYILLYKVIYRHNFRITCTDKFLNTDKTIYNWFPNSTFGCTVMYRKIIRIINIVSDTIQEVANIDGQCYYNYCTRFLTKEYLVIGSEGQTKIIDIKGTQVCRIPGSWSCSPIGNNMFIQHDDNKMNVYHIEKNQLKLIQVVDGYIGNFKSIDNRGYIFSKEFGISRKNGSFYYETKPYIDDEYMLVSLYTYKGSNRVEEFKCRMYTILLDINMLKCLCDIVWNYLENYLIIDYSKDFDSLTCKIPL